jgi:hypothetical protein
VVIALAIGIGAFLVLRHRAPRGGSPVRDADPTEPVAASPPVGDPENEPEE